MERITEFSPLPLSSPSLPLSPSLLLSFSSSLLLSLSPLSLSLHLIRTNYQIKCVKNTLLIGQCAFEYNLSAFGIKMAKHLLMPIHDQAEVRRILELTEIHSMCPCTCIPELLSSFVRFVYRN